VNDISLLALSPYAVPAATAVAAMLVATFTRSHRALAGLTSAGLMGTFASILLLAASTDRRATSLVRIDDLALYFMGLLVLVSLAVVAVSYVYLDRTERRVGDYYALLCTATTGALVLPASAHFASFFLGLEVLGVSLYGMVAYQRRRWQADEAGLKYLVLGGVTSAFLVFGMALVYGASGSMNLATLMTTAGALTGWEAVAMAVGSVMMFTAVGFKLAFVPFHLWAPDVYQGASAPTTAFLATVSKVAIFAVFVRFLVPLGSVENGALSMVLTIVAYASMLVGNLLALSEHNIKRLLAYSSIAQLGYLAVAVVAGGTAGTVAVCFYLSVYALALVAAFGVVGILSHGDTEAERVAGYQGLFHRRPVPALVLMVSMLSLAGVPVFGGFIGKFLIVRAGGGASLWGLLIVLALTSAMSLYYYLKVIIIMFRSGGASCGGIMPSDETSNGGRGALGVVSLLAVLIVVLGVYPSPLLSLVERLISGAG
jgi:NADH-quinone oxidoreductase subunit N